MTSHRKLKSSMALFKLDTMFYDIIGTDVLELNSNQYDINNSSNQFFDSFVLVELIWRE